jgi:hypothetical protein
MQLILTNLKHFFATLTLLLALAFALALYFGIDIDYGDDERAYKVGDEGPHVFFQGGQLQLNHIRGSREQGFYLQQQGVPLSQRLKTEVYFPLENTSFSVEIHGDIKTPAIEYQDDEPILVLSDIESAYKSLRDFLIAAKVIDKELNWTFGKGHLVLLGDFVDRDSSTTQVLWFIYQLEQLAQRQGGTVHYILGNHEIKNLQGNFQSAAKKYQYVATLLGKHQYELYGEQSLLGRWLASKNTAELINGHLFVHGGLHPKLAELNYNLQDLNQIVRSHYRIGYFPKPDQGNVKYLLSTRYGPSWYRGYFEDDLSQQQVEATLAKFNAKAVVVGHTPQWRVKSLYQGKVLAVNVKHPRDYRGSIPPRRSEGLLIRQGQYYRLNAAAEQSSL